MPKKMLDSDFQFGYINKFYLLNFHSSPICDNRLVPSWGFNRHVPVIPCLPLTSTAIALSMELQNLL
jgi:hypothetical protein